MHLDLLERGKALADGVVRATLAAGDIVSCDLCHTITGYDGDEVSVDVLKTVIADRDENLEASEAEAIERAKQVTGLETFWGVPGYSYLERATAQPTHMSPWLRKTRSTCG